MTTSADGAGDSNADVGIRALRGRTTFSARALQHLATGLAKDAADVAARDVTVRLSDDAGDLRVSVVVPMLITKPSRSVDVQSRRLRAGIISGLADLAGRRVSAVDVRFTGVKHFTERRVI
ncbi:hypothetical protein GCM10027421_13250 [Microbacterium shaanxiense]